MSLDPSTFLNISKEENLSLLLKITKAQFQIPAENLLSESVDRVTVDCSHITIEIKISEIIRLLSEKSGVNVSIQGNTPKIRKIRAPYISRRAHKGTTIIEPTNELAGQKTPLNLSDHEVKNLIRGLIWRDEHFHGKTISKIARREKFSEKFVNKCIYRTFELIQ